MNHGILRLPFFVNRRLFYFNRNTIALNVGVLRLTYDGIALSPLSLAISQCRRHDIKKIKNTRGTRTEQNKKAAGQWRRVGGSLRGGPYGRKTRLLGSARGAAQKKNLRGESFFNYNGL